MEAIVEIHAYIMFFLVVIVTFVFTALGCVVYQFWWADEADGDRRDALVASKVVHSTWLEVFWTLVPVGVLVVIAMRSFALLYSMEEKFDSDVTVKAVGHQWYWEYQYAVGTKLLREVLFRFDSYMKADSDLEVGQLRLLATDTAVLLPRTTRIRLLTTSADVIHSWALPAAGVKMDAIPGRLNQVNLFFNRPGVFHGQCSELCGVNHAFMPITVKALSAERFRAWVDRQADQ
jgi:cytochrome c oxidase subunit II